MAMTMTSGSYRRNTGQQTRPMVEINAGLTVVGGTPNPDATKHRCRAVLWPAATTEQQQLQ